MLYLYLLLVILIGVIASRKFRNIIRHFVDGLLEVAPAFLIGFGIIVILCLAVIFLWERLKLNLLPWKDIGGFVLVMIGLFIIAQIIIYLDSLMGKKFGRKNVERVYDFIGVMTKEVTILIFCALPMVMIYQSLETTFPHAHASFIWGVIIIGYFPMRYLMILIIRSLRKIYNNRI